MIAELVTVVIVIVSVKLALWAVPTALVWIRRRLFWLRRWRADRRAQPKPDEVQQLLCEQLHDPLVA